MKISFVARIPGQHNEFYRTDELTHLPRPGDYVQTPNGEGEVHSVTFLIDSPESEVAVLVKLQGLN